MLIPPRYFDGLNLKKVIKLARNNNHSECCEKQIITPRLKTPMLGKFKFDDPTKRKPKQEKNTILSQRKDFFQVRSPPVSPTKDKYEDRYDPNNQRFDPPKYEHKKRRKSKSPADHRKSGKKKSKVKLKDERLFLMAKELEREHQKAKISKSQAQFISPRLAFPSPDLYPNLPGSLSTRSRKTQTPAPHLPENFCNRAPTSIGELHYTETQFPRHKKEKMYTNMSSPRREREEQGIQTVLPRSIHSSQSVIRKKKPTYPQYPPTQLPNPFQQQNSQDWLHPQQENMSDRIRKYNSSSKISHKNINQHYQNVEQLPKISTAYGYDNYEQNCNDYMDAHHPVKQPLRYMPKYSRKEEIPEHYVHPRMNSHMTDGVLMNMTIGMNMGFNSEFNSNAFNVRHHNFSNAPHFHKGGYW